MSAIKLTLEDGREFEVGEVVETNPSGLLWQKAVIDLMTEPGKIGIVSIALNPQIIRKLPPVREADLTNADVLEMLRKGGYEWKHKGTKEWHSGCYTIDTKGRAYIHHSRVSNYSHYRHTSDMIEHPMTKKEGVV